MPQVGDGCEERPHLRCRAGSDKEVSDGFLPDRGTMLMFARLAVEAEMDK